MKRKSFLMLLAFSLFLTLISLVSQKSLANFCDGLLPYTVGSVESIDDIVDVHAPGVHLDGVNRLVIFHQFEPFVMPEEEFLFLRILLTEKDYRRTLSEMAVRTGKNPLKVIESLNQIFRQFDPQFDALQVFEGSVHWRISVRSSGT